MKAYFIVLVAIVYSRTSHTEGSVWERRPGHYGYTTSDIATYFRHSQQRFRTTQPFIRSKFSRSSGFSKEWMNSYNFSYKWTCMEKCAFIKVCDADACSTSCTKEAENALKPNKNDIFDENYWWNTCHYCPWNKCVNWAQGECVEVPSIFPPSNYYNGNYYPGYYPVYCPPPYTNPMRYS